MAIDSTPFENKEEVFDAMVDYVEDTQSEYKPYALAFIAALYAIASDMNGVPNKIELVGADGQIVFTWGHEAHLSEATIRYNGDGDAVVIFLTGETKATFIIEDGLELPDIVTYLIRNL